MADPNYKEILDFIDKADYINYAYREYIQNIKWECLETEIYYYDYNNTIDVSEYTRTIYHYISEFISLIKLCKNPYSGEKYTDIDKIKSAAYEPIFLQLLKKLIITNYDNFRQGLLINIIYFNYYFGYIILDYLKENGLFNYFERINLDDLLFDYPEQRDMAKYIYEEQIKLRWLWLGIVCKEGAKII